jgi:phage regulator Rha-like protein
MSNSDLNIQKPTEIIRFETLESKLIKYNNEFVLIDSDVASIYGVETRDINKAVKNNPDKFPDEYIFELKKDELEVLRGKNSTTKLSKTRVLPKVFTEKGLYMLATILKGKHATQTTIAIIETFTNIRKLSRNLNSIDENQTKEEQQALVTESNILLEKVIDIEPIVKLQDDETEVETKIELNLGFMKVSRVIKTKNFKENS